MAKCAQCVYMAATIVHLKCSVVQQIIWFPASTTETHQSELGCHPPTLCVGNCLRDLRVSDDLTVDDPLRHYDAIKVKNFIQHEMNVSPLPVCVCVCVWIVCNVGNG